MKGEPNMIAAPQGVGKTTLSQRLALARAQVGPTELLGMRVERDERPVLYIAADRPRQAARSLRRMVGERDRQRLAERLIVWPGPLPFDLAHEPERLAEFVMDYGAGTVVIDSLKDVARDLSKDETGSRVNLASSTLSPAGIELLVDHHQGKEGADGSKPRKLDDVYGSTWLTAGTGSVLLLWGQPGDSIVDLRHLKQPAEAIGPLKVRHDHELGMPAVYGGGDLYDLVHLAQTGVSVSEAARHLFGSTEPSAWTLA